MFKKGVVIKADRLKLTNTDCKTILLFSLFLCGVILGVFLIKNCNEDINDAISVVWKNYISAKSNCGFLACFSGCFISLTIFIIFAFLFGLSAVGTPLVLFVPIAFGLACGGCVSLMLSNYGLKGLFYCIIVELLPYAITTATLVKCCCESTKLSVELFSCIAGANAVKGKNMFKDFVFTYLVLCVPVVIGALISAFCFKVFQGLFIFT